MYGIIVQNVGLHGCVTWCKHDGKIILYATQEEAEKKAQELNDSQGPINHFNHYFAEKYVTS